MRIEPKGIIPALVTPLLDDEAVDEQALRKLVNHVVNGGVHGIFVTGTQGEAFALTPTEREKVTAVVLEEVRGRVPVYVGTGAITTAETIRFTRLAAEQGAAAVSIVTPYFLKPTQKELVAHYRAIAESVDVPILLYNLPGRTGGVSIEISTVEALLPVPNIIGIKDSSGSLIQTEEYILATRGKNFCVLVGNDALIAAGLLMGADGSIAATANVAPRLLVGIYDAVRAGDLSRARELQYQLLPLRRAFALGTFPVVIKEALSLIGVPAGPARSPVGRLTEETREQLRIVLASMGLLP